jgi:acetyl/propionyl-CoA carboxylase alpha subunit
MGKPLSFTQNDLDIQGHAMEVRVYAEDPMNNFAPDIGRLKTYKLPESIGIRVDNGFEEGMDIPIYYDSMISKLITYGKDREEAISKMIRAIRDYTIVGVKTTLPFADFVMQNKHFVSGDFDTHFIKKHFNVKDLEESREDESHIAALLSKHLLSNHKKSMSVSSSESSVSKWKKNRL